MKTRTILGTGLLIFGLSTAGIAQNYHTAFHSLQNVNALLDYLETPHLLLSVCQPDKSVMKFRIAFSNPNGRRATITIRKKDDVYFYENVAGQEYVSLYDLGQLEDGDYQVIVTGGKERVSSRISIHTETQVSREVTVH